MARPKRFNVDYFPFLCEDGNKMFYLEETYGNDGFATFVKLLRELARTDNHYLDLSKPSTKMFLSAKCKVSKATLENIINDLVELEKFDKQLWDENSIIWCQDFIDSIQDAYAKRTNKCIDKNSLLLLLESKGVRKPSKKIRKQSLGSQSSANNPQRIVKDSIVKENKVNNKTKKQFNARKFLLDLGGEENLIIDWLKVRKNKKATNTETAFNNFKKELSKSKYNINQILSVCVTNSWSGFKSSWEISGYVDNNIDLNPNNEEVITFNSNVNPTLKKLPKSEFLKLQEKNKDGGYIYKIIK